MHIEESMNWYPLPLLPLKFPYKEAEARLTLYPSYDIYN